MKILVIGGTRYFGKRLVHLLLKNQHEVSVLSRGKLPEDLKGKVEKLTANRSSEQELSHATQGRKFDVVIDQVCMDAKDALGVVNVLKEKTSHYIMTSTMAVYDLGGDIREEKFSPLRDSISSTSLYAQNKREAEKIIVQNQMQASFLRIPIVLGHDDYTGRLENTVKGIQNGTPQSLPNLNAKFAYISSSDAARALLWLCETRYPGAYNFSTEAITLGELIKLIEEEAKTEAIITNEGTHPFGIENDWYMNVEKVTKLGFRCEPLLDWLRPLIQYYVKKGPPKRASIDN